MASVRNYSDQYFSFINSVLTIPNSQITVALITATKIRVTISSPFGSKNYEAEYTEFRDVNDSSFVTPAAALTALQTFYSLAFGSSKFYKLKLSQSGTSAPTVNQLEFPQGVSAITPSRLFAGVYRLTGAAGQFPLANTLITTDSRNDGNHAIYTIHQFDNIIGISTVTIPVVAGADSVLDNFTICIEVKP